MTSVVSAQNRLAGVETAVSALGPRIDVAAASGNFAGVLAAARTAIDALSGSPASSSPNGLVPSQAQAQSGTNGIGSGAGSSLAPTGSMVVDDAQRYLGVPYQWGGTNPSTGLDCSGLVQLAYADVGVNLPRTSQEQATVGQPVTSLAQAQPGDLVFFDPGPTGPGHVGIYMGGGQMIDAPHTGTNVQVQAIVGEPVAIRRVLSAPSGPGWSSISGPMSSSGSWLGVPPSLAPLFLSSAAKHGLSPQLLAAVAKVESGFDPGATSPAGAEGLMQIMPATAAGMGINPYDPAQAIDAAGRILAGNLAHFGSVPLALAAYNAGAGAVETYGGIPPYPETQAYVQKITALMGTAPR
ncbi:MAG: NlpC/P60 family protein [Acidimicrobiales bacterium]